MMRLETIPSWITESRWDASKLLFRIRSSQFDYGVPLERIEASFPDSEFRVGIRSSDATHRSFFSGFGVPSSISEFRCVAPSFNASSRRHPARRFLSKDGRCKSPGFPNHKEPCGKEKGRYKRSQDPGPRTPAGRESPANHRSTG